jgi:uncharacterized membrane protein YphA (DoxX/SURF4 family)
MDANMLLWIGQILLALAFLAFGYGHILRFDQMWTRPGMTWLAAVGRDRMRIIGALEILGAIGLILPAATGVLPWLTPVAATALAVLMVLAIVLHARRQGEGRNIIGNAILGAMATLIAYGRFVIAPF